MPATILSEDSNQRPSTESTVIMRTKLNRPRIFMDLVPRTSMVKKWGTLLHRPATIVSAPAGYGKSTMASLWLEAWKGPCAWVSLGEEENDLRMFLSYLLAAVRQAVPEACGPTRSLLQARSLPPVAILSRYFLNDLNEIEDPFILVLDDYHSIQEPKVHDLMTTYMAHPPQSMHLMLLTRHDPPLLTATLRGRGQVNEIGRFDLQFTVEETAHFFKKNLELTIDGKTAAVIHDKIDGWPTGMCLISQSLKHSDDVGRLMAVLGGGFGAIVDYLSTEVLLQQTPETVRLMVKTAILDRFCASLFDVVCDPNIETGQPRIDGTAFISKLKKDNLFLIGLDPENNWFRYHHLFHDFLRSELKQRYSSEEIATLHSRAGQWYAENGLIEEALRHLFVAGDSLQALKLIEQHRHDLMNHEQWQHLERLLHLVPAEIHEKSPILLITQAWSCEFQSLSTKAYAYRDQAEALISQTSPESSENTLIVGEIEALRAHQYYLSAQGDKASASAQRALKRLPPDAHSIRNLALAYRAFALQMTGDLHQGLKLIRQALEKKSMRHDKYHLARLWFAVCFANFIEGNLPETKQSALRCLRYAEELDLAESTSLANYFLGSCCYLQNKLPEAMRYLAAVFDNPFSARPLYVVQSGFALALGHIAQGDSEKAQQFAESAVSFATEIDGPLELELARAFMAELAYRQGRLVEADRWAQHHNPLPMVFVARFYIPQLTQIKVLLAQNTAKTRDRAANLLAQIQNFSKSIHHNRILVELTALQAMLLDQQGAEPAALGKLTEALTLAQTGGFIRTFLDLGAPMADLLKRLQKQNIAVDYIDVILTAFMNDEHRTVLDTADGDGSYPHHPISKAPLTPPPSSSHQPLVEPLTNREFDVMELLAQRFQNKEIAEKLFISTGTVKSHLRNIYEKLNVGNRRDAVVEAKKIRIL